ncbi:Cyclic di-GMP phosphodiesterase response regulator RpfG [Gammaproteobacteria bacterium]
MKLSVVIVDDSEVNLTLFNHLVTRIEGLEPLCFESSQIALDWCATDGADIVIVDYMMPAPDGLEFIRQFRSIPGLQDVPVIMITANDLKEVRYKALQTGATDFLTKPVDKHEFTARIRNMATLRHNQKLLANRAALLAQEVAAATATIVERERETIFRLSKAAEYRDPETGGHILRMAHVSRLIAERLGLPLPEQQLLLEAAPMHDIGKVGTPDHILLKPGRLDEAEFAIMKRHAEIGHGILKNSKSPILNAAATIALTHHEKFDGKGYPRGLQGEEIPLHGRIVAVADVFDALTSVRPYKTAWEPDAARHFIIDQSGSHFDPACVAPFLDAWDEVLEIRARFQDEEHDSPHAPLPHGDPS